MNEVGSFEFWALLVVALVFGLAIGILIGSAVRGRREQPTRVRVRELESEIRRYRERVDEHFKRSSTLFQELTGQYRKLYEHLAQGATELSNSKTVGPGLESAVRSLPQDRASSRGSKGPAQFTPSPEGEKKPGTTAG